MAHDDDEELRKRINEGSPAEHAIVREVLGIDWYDVESQARSMVYFCVGMRQALTLTVQALDSLLPHLAKVPADIGLINEALCTARKLTGPLPKAKPVDYDFCDGVED